MNQTIRSWSQKFLFILPCVAAVAFVICILFLNFYISVRNTAVVVAVLFIPVFIGYLIDKNHRSFNAFINISLVLYLIMLLQTTLLKGSTLKSIMYFRTSLSDYLYSSTSFIPFASIFDMIKKTVQNEISILSCILNFLGNFILLMPLSIYLKIRKCNIKKSFVVLIIVSVFIETTQLLITFGRTDIDDVILNLLGGCLAYIIIDRCMVRLKNGQVTTDKSSSLQTKDVK